MVTSTPPYPRSTLIGGVVVDRWRAHCGQGDMWPITWAGDGHLYGGAGDVCGSPMSIWRIVGEPGPPGLGGMVWTELVNVCPVDPSIYCQRPDVHRTGGVKPASILAVGERLFLAVELHNYGDNPSFNRQRNVAGWIIFSDDYGKTWDLHATEPGFFAGRLSSPHFIQFGAAYAGARDNYAYAFFPVGDDGGSYWENGDALLLGRVPVDAILDRDAWQFFSAPCWSSPKWSTDDSLATPVFRYPSMTGENHCSFNAGLGRYILGNYGFLDEAENPRPYHADWPKSIMRSQLTIYESPEPWGPWSLFYRDDDWGTYGDYQPSFPTKWMSLDGREMIMSSSGSMDDYNLTLQRMRLDISS